MNWREYHELTKHTPEKLRQSAHSLDWVNMPDPFRHYEGVPVLDLPADPPPPDLPTLEVLHGKLGQSAMLGGPRFLSQLLFYSAAISAAKRVPSTGYKYALRVNPSSGNLHPTEFHFATRGLRDWPDGLYHYRPSSHMAEQRAIGQFDLPAGGSVAFVLTSIAWREAWKYRDRAYRYCLLDIGHAGEALTLAARTIGCDATSVVDFDDDALAQQCGLAADEWPMMVIGLRPAATPAQATGEPNELSPHQVAYPSITQVHESTKPHITAPSLPSRPFGEVARTRRSALDFRGGAESISRAQLSAILQASNRPGLIQLYVYVHRVDGVPPGVYRHAHRTGELELIKPGDQRVVAAGLSLGQDLAGNACFALSMIADLETAERLYGERGYRYAHFQAGAIGQRLYLAAEALGLRATGMGAFYDDAVHQYLGLTPQQGQVVYHFAIGYPVVDSRLEA